ncbi:hypothetical protein OHB12_18175 [Nocardia sp. NBC_01730]|uniref:hypothetical protein n=1 Tax=Nocardia sp. NBC_01730 TaxID=2975998 RepID=UPI002E0D501E|nr:hypothetical protein OHB12_18175 [Nocardia sp. NBC_01730]
MTNDTKEHSERSQTQLAEPNSPDTCTRPKAVGFVRGEVSGLHAPRHAVAVQQHARSLGYQYVYTVTPPRDNADPIGFVLAVAAGLDVAAIVVYDLAHVDDQPARVCEDFDLETVCPPGTWARVTAPTHTIAKVAGR